MGWIANSAYVARVSCARRKFKELFRILTREEVLLKLKGKVYGASVGSAMVHGSETGEDVDVWQIAEELRETLGIEPASDVVKSS